jgi:hypothetical protein
MCLYCVADKKVIIYSEFEFVLAAHIYCVDSTVVSLVKQELCLGLFTINSYDKNL